MIKDLESLRAITETLTQNGYLIDQTKEWEYAFDAMPDCVFVINLEFKMRFVNKVMCERLGSKREDLLDKMCFDILKCTDRECKLNYSEEETRDCVEKSYDIGEFYINELSGWFKFTKSVIEDSNNKILGFICVLRDITERKRAEELLWKSGMQLRSTLESTADGILAVDNEGKILHVNARFVELWQIPQYILELEDDQTMLNFVLIQLTDPSAFLKKVNLLYNSDAVDIDTVSFKDGRFFERYSRPMNMNGIRMGRVWSFRDVTERKKAEIALEKQEAMLRSIFRTMPAGTGVISSPGRKVLIVNDTLCNMLGYTKAELEGQSVKIFYTSDAEFMRVGIEKYAQIEKCGIGDLETQFKCKNGSVIDIRLRTTPIGNDDIFGCEAFNFTASDITAFKVAEEKIKRDRDRLDSLLKLSQIEDEEELTSQALEEAVKFTNSKIGYFHFIEDDEIHLTLFKWSKKVLEGGMCTTKRTEHYPLTEAGIWADCIRIRKPVVHNDYNKYPYKKGLPEGHVELKRHMSVPIFLDEKVVGIMGVGNKTNPYNDYDVTQVNLFAQHMIDIVKRVRAEKEKRISEIKYKQLFDVTPTGIYEINFRTVKITYVNDSMCEHTGYSREEILEMSPLNLLGPKSQTRFIERIAAVQKGEIISPNAEFRVIRKDGSRFWIKISATYKFDAIGLVSATVVATDITKEKDQIEQLKLARDSARHANEILSAVYEFLPAVAILATTNDYTIKDVNQNFTEITGWTKEEAVGKTTQDLKLYENDQQRMDMRKLLEAHNYTLDNLISNFYSKEGKLLKGLTSVRRFKCGDEDCLIAITRDITDIEEEICK